MLHAVIMAGGAGTRFWPASRVATPKQLLDFTGGRTMIQATVDRLGDMAPAERVLVLTNQQLVEPICEQLQQLPPQSIVGEPCKRDTAPCIGLAALLVSHRDDDATMVVMPADHVIQPDSMFRAAVSHAAELVEKNPGRIVTFGINPDYPAETFGYIERGEQEPTPDDRPNTFHVKQFREKPDAETARQYLETGRFYWNGGIFVWKAKTILDALAKFEPEMFAHLNAIGNSVGTDDFQHVLEREFAAIHGKSIDFAVMERYDDVVVIEAPFQWDDVGNWPSLARLQGTDSKGNTISGRQLAIDTSNSIVRTDADHLIVTVGVSDLIIVHTPDATLVAHRDSEESIREVVRQLKEKEWDEYL